jgi:hypothetical protein
MLTNILLPNRFQALGCLLLLPFARQNKSLLILLPK